MRSSTPQPMHHFSARATSGQLLDIRYDAAANAIVFVESCWSADARGAPSPRSSFRATLENAANRRPARHRAA